MIKLKDGVSKFTNFDTPSFDFARMFCLRAHWWSFSQLCTDVRICNRNGCRADAENRLRITSAGFMLKTCWIFRWLKWPLIRKKSYLCPRKMCIHLIWRGIWHLNGRVALFSNGLADYYLEERSCMSLLCVAEFGQGDN